MSWKIATVNELNKVKKFLLKEEWQAVTVSENLRLKLSGLFYPLRKQTEIYINEQAGELRDLLLFTSNGLIYPVFTSNPPDLNNIEDLINFPNRRVHSIMGLSRNVQAFLSTLNLSYHFQVNYDFLCLDKVHFLPDSHHLAGCTIKKAKTRDRHKLFPLQKDYELEEVYLDPGNFQAHACLRNLKNKLSQQKIYYLDKNGPIAKAGTNAQGFKVDQIGGVFTKKEFRNQGYSSFLMKFLLSQLFKTKEKIVLFVKPENLSAQRVYKKLNFKAIDQFQINYF
ncbi:MAG: GNAT family N-acetyltransferase [Spirochaetales bacterium]|nr:GNAT family N-acetyltransferase [Spirochaetales bacterium]